MSLYGEMQRSFEKEVLDVGCGHGGLLKKVRRRMGVEVMGVDLRPPEGGAREFPILKLDAVREALPRADVAVSVCLVHHLREEEFVEMIRNVGRACRRFVILDLVRHRVPLAQSWKRSSTISSMVPGI